MDLRAHRRHCAGQFAGLASVWANDGEGRRCRGPWPVVANAQAGGGRITCFRSSGSTVNQPHTLASVPRMPHAQYLANNTILTLQRLRQRFPNLRLAYLSSRIYAGYCRCTRSTRSLMPIEGAFAVRWVIQAQAKGDPLLNFDPSRGTVMAPAIVWGPYLWTDGVQPHRATAWSGSRKTSVRTVPIPAIPDARRSPACWTRRTHWPARGTWPWPTILLSNPISPNKPEFPSMNAPPPRHTVRARAVYPL